MINAPLVSTDWLADHLGDPGLVIFDASWFLPGTPRDPAEEYAEAHIPGAIRFDIDAVADHSRGLPHMLAPPRDFAVAMRRAGVNPESKVVVYDSEGLFSAPRVWWNLRAMGHDAVFILDGGLPRWKAEGRPVETGWREALHGEFKAQPRPELVRDLAQVSAAITSRSEQLVDARAAARFRGEAPEPRPGLRGGHMPGALNVPWSVLVENGSLLPSDQLRRCFQEAGVDLTRPIVTTCGSGVSASVLALALAAIGRDDVAVYDGSWSEWGADPRVPVVVGP